MHEDTQDKESQERRNGSGAGGKDDCLMAFHVYGLLVSLPVSPFFHSPPEYNISLFVSLSAFK